MPPVNMARFNHLAYAIVDPPHAASATNIRDALIAKGGHPWITMAPSFYGALLLMFERNAVWETTIDAAPFLDQEHTVLLECHDESTNWFQFEHEVIIYITIRDYPMEH